MGKGAGNSIRMTPNIVKITTKRLQYFYFRLFTIAFAVACWSSVEAQTGGVAGTFTNMGYGPRGIAMGNSLTALTTGNITALYNPSLGAFESDRSVYASYSSLGLDRTFNVLAVNATIPVYKKSSSSQKDTLPDSLRTRVSTIGISAGIVNTGVSNIDSRDAEGMPLGMLSTYQNIYFGSVSIRFRPELSVGILIKFLSAKLTNQITSGGLGLDVGAVYQISDALSVAAVIQNMFAQYRWDSTPLYNEQGQTTTDNFPVYFHLGAAYRLIETGATFTADFEQSSANTTILRGGVEYGFNQAFAIRAGIDGYNITNPLAETVHPSFGLSITEPVGPLKPTVEYAAYNDPVLGLINVIALAIQF